MRDMIAALPKDAKSLNKLAKKCPDNDGLEHDEMWVMADTGATVNAQSQPRLPQVHQACP